MNIIHTLILNNKSHDFVMYQQDANMNDLKVFGFLSFESTLQTYITKLSPRERKCIFLGYKTGLKGIVLLDINNK